MHFIPPSAPRILVARCLPIPHSAFRNAPLPPFTFHVFTLHDPAALLLSLSGSLPPAMISHNSPLNGFTIMRALAFWKTVTVDRTDFLDRLIALLTDHSIRYCVVGGQAVNAYAEPVVSLDLDLAIAVEQLSQAETLLYQAFRVERFPHSLNVSAPGSDLRVQIQTDPRYAAFVDQATLRDLLGLRLPVARLEDVLQGKVWAVMDTSRRPSKRQKDLADIARLVEVSPSLRQQLPAEVLTKLV